MVEIVKRGKIPEEIKHDVRCTRCHTHFRCTTVEAKYSGDPREPCYLIDCPVCGTNCSFIIPPYYGR